MRTITDIDQWGAKPTDLHLLSTVHCVDDENNGVVAGPPRMATLRNRT
jgi:hypothetical protein